MKERTEDYHTRPGGSSLDAVRPEGRALVGVAIAGLKRVTTNDIYAKHGHIYIPYSGNLCG